MHYVIRHGQTDINKERKMQGRRGLALNEKGVEQANVLKSELQNINFHYVFSSPQKRAIQTAEIISGKRPVIDERLNVFDLGEADGLPVKEVKLAGRTPDPNVYNGVEDPNSFVERLFNFMKELENQYGKEEVNILISGHRCTSGGIGAYFEGIPTDQNILKYSSNNGEYKTYEFI